MSAAFFTRDELRTYMQSQSERDRMRNRGILTREDRKVFRGEQDADEDRLQDIRWNIEQRMDRIERDLDILEAAGEDELVDEFYKRFSVSSRLRAVEQKLNELEDGRGD